MPRNNLFGLTSYVRHDNHVSSWQILEEISWLLFNIELSFDLLKRFGAIQTQKAVVSVHFISVKSILI